MQWIDLRPVGARAFLVEQQRDGGGNERFILVQQGDGISPSLRALGFRRHTSRDLWLRPAAGLTLRAIVGGIPGSQLRTDIPVQEFARKLAQPLDVAAFTLEAGSIAPPKIDWAVEQARAEPLGLNDLGERVFEHPSLGRVVVTASGPVLESRLGGSRRFLRIATPGDATALLSGLVRRAMDPNGGVPLTTGTWMGFVEATSPAALSRETWSASMAARLADVALTECLVHERRGYREVFDAAHRLTGAASVVAGLRRDHPEVAPYLRMPGAIAFQRALAQVAGSEGRVEIHSPAPASFLGLFGRGVNLRAVGEPASPGVEQAVLRALEDGGHAVFRSKSEGEGEGFDAGLFEASPTRGEAVDLGGFVTNRLDLISLARFLEQRSARGLVAALLDWQPEHIEAETEAFRRWLGRRYALEGTADMLSSVWQRPDGGRTLALAIGERRPAPVLEPPPETWDIRTIDTVEELWSWTSDLLATRAAIRLWHEHAGQDQDDQAEALQHRYASASQLVPARTSVARALHGATSQALARLNARCAEVHGVPNVDALVARDLGVEQSRLAEILSAEQIDAVGLAIDAERRGRGFLLGDQMGLGKGRTLAAMMSRALRQGKKVLFLTERAINIPDIVRDFVDIGMWDLCRPLILNRGVKVVDEEGVVLAASDTDEDRSRLLRGLAWPEGRNLVIGTYSQFSAARFEGEPAEFTGVKLSSFWVREALDENCFVVLDESHNVAAGTGNAASNLTRGMSRVPFVMFSSATWAKNAANFEIYKPIMPVGISNEHLAALMGRGGIAMQEIFSTMLAKDGLFLARQHDLSSCRFEMQDVSPGERVGILAAMDRLTDILSELAILSREVDKRVGHYNEALMAMLRERLGNDDERVARDMRRLEMRRMSMGSPLYEISRAFLASALVDTAARVGVEALSNGEKPVFLFDRTMGAILRDVEAMMASRELQGVPDFREFLRKTVARMFKLEGKPLAALRHMLEEPGWPMAAERMLDVLREAHPETLSPEDVPSALEAAMARVVMDWPGDADALGVAAETIEARLLAALTGTGGRIVPGFWNGVDAAIPMTSERALRRLNRLIDRLPVLPLSAIDALKEAIEREGQRRAREGLLERPWVVGEITGRDVELRDCEVRRSGKADRRSIAERFQNGGIDALVINTAGATGIDLHAAEKYLDHRPRVMIEVQSPADITRQIQAYGRVNRLGQIHTPRIVTLTTGLPVESRILALRNTKLRRLSASVTGSRDNPGLLQDVPDLMNAVGDEVCRRYFEARPDLGERLGLNANAFVAVDRQEEDAIGIEERRDTQRAASWYLARLALLPSAMQERVLREIDNEYKAAIEELDARGENPLREDSIQGRVETQERALFEGAEDDAASAFRAPVYLEKVRIRHRERPLRWQDVLSRVEEAEAAEILGAATPARMAQLLQDRRDGYFRSLGGIDDAAGQDTFRQRIRHRVERMIDALERLRPGVAVSLLQDGQAASAVVLGIHGPDLNKGVGTLFHPASYRLDLAMPGLANPLQISLATLLNYEGFHVDAGLHGERRDAIRMEFILREGREFSEERWLLTGNLFSAMATNVSQKLGKLVSWRRADGAVERGILVSKRHQDLSFLPVRVSEPEIVHRTLNVSADVRAYSTSELSHHGVRIQYKQSRRGCGITLPKESCRRFGHLHQLQGFAGWFEDAKNLAFQNIFEEKTALYSVFIPSSDIAEQAISRLLSALGNAGHSFYFASRYRETINQLTAAFARERDERAWIENGPPVVDGEARRVA